MEELSVDVEKSENMNLESLGFLKDQLFMPYMISNNMILSYENR